MFVKRVFVKLLCLVLLSLVFTVVGAQEEMVKGQRPDAPPYALHGPYTVGTADFVVDPEGDEPFMLSVWYPAQGVEGSVEPATYDYGAGGVVPDPMNYIQGTAIRDAVPDTSQAPYPLVVFSPGLGASRMFTLYLLEHLASYGFVVIAPDHVGTRLVDQMTMEPAAFAEQVFLVQALRPLQMARAIDYAETITAPDGNLADMIDLDKVALGGYSAGGWAALALAGGQIDFSYLRDWCAQGSYASMIVSTVCGRSAQGSLEDEEQRLKQLAGLNASAGSAWSPITEPGVDAVFVLAPGGVLTFGESGLQNVDVPTLILYGSADPTAIPEFNALWTYDHLGSAHKGVVTFEGGGHMMFGQCNAAWTANVPEFCMDAVWDMPRVYDLTNHLGTAFLMTELYGDEDAASVLTPEAVQFPGIAYETTGF